MSDTYVSVIMPVYQVEATIAAAIDSVLAQGYPHFELLIIDDGGKDGSIEIARRYKDPRITIVEQENRGLAGARNTGIRHAKGRYIAFIDSDDLWEPEKLAWHVRHLDDNPHVGVSYSGSLLIDEAGRSLGLYQKPKADDVTPKDVFCRNPVGNGSAPVIRRAALLAIAFDYPSRGYPCYFDESFRQSEDIECWLRLALLTPWRFEGTDRPLTRYRVNESGLSANMDKQFESWDRVRRKVGLYAPKFCEEHGKAALAFQCRYLARRAIRSADAAAARRWINKAWAASPKALLSEAPKSLFTTLVVLFLSVAPPVLRVKFQSIFIGRMRKKAIPA